MKYLVPIVIAFALVGCSKNDSPTSPGTSTPPPATTFSLNGLVTSSGAALGGAILLIADGSNQGRTATTDATGNYSFSGLPQSVFTLQASASGHTPQNKSVNLNASQIISFALVKPNPIFVRGGSGDTVFDMPTYVSRVRIMGIFAGFSSNFIVRIGGRLVVNELLGTGWGPTTFNGTYLTTGGVVEITNSSGVSWSFTEVR